MISENLPPSKSVLFAWFLAVQVLFRKIDPIRLLRPGGLIFDQKRGGEYRAGPAVSLILNAQYELVDFGPKVNVGPQRGVRLERNQTQQDWKDMSPDVKALCAAILNGRKAMQEHRAKADRQNLETIVKAEGSATG
jgi:hypothetical protein